MKSTAIKLVAAALVVWGALALHLYERPRTAELAPADAIERVETSPDTVFVHSQPAASRVSPQAPPVLASSATSASSVSAGPAKSDSHSLPGDDGADEFGAFYEQAFTAEAVDATWSAAEQQALGDHFTRLNLAGVKVFVEAITCRTSMCRLAVHFDDRRARDAFLSDLGNPPFHHGGHFHKDTRSGALLMDTARANHPFPQPTQDG